MGVKVLILTYQILLVVGIIAGGYTVGLYLITQKSPLKNPIGKMLLSFSSVALAFYIFNLIRTIWPDIPRSTIELVRFFLFVACTLAIIYRAIAFTTLNKIIKREHEKLVQLDREEG